MDFMKSRDIKGFAILQTKLGLGKAKIRRQPGRFSRIFNEA